MSQDILVDKISMLTKFTNVNVPEIVQYFLSLGSKFSLPNIYLPTFNIIASVKKGTSHLEHIVKETVRGKFSNIPTNAQLKLKSCKTINNTEGYSFIGKTKEFLKNNPNICYKQINAIKVLLWRKVNKDKKLILC